MKKTKSKKLKKFVEKRIRENSTIDNIMFNQFCSSQEIEKLELSNLQLTASVEQLAIELFELKNEVSDQEFEQKLKEKEDERQD